MYPFKSLAILILVIVQMKMFPEIGDLLQILQHCFSLWLNLIFAFSQFKANPPAVTFKLTGETDGIFQIQPDGLLYHNKTLDRETRAVHRLQVSWRQTTDTNSSLWALEISLTHSSPAQNTVSTLLTLMTCLHISFVHIFFKPTREWFGKGSLVFRLFDQGNPSYTAKALRRVTHPK